MAVSGIFGKRNLSSVKAQIEFPEEIYASASIPLKVVMLNNRKFLPAFMIRVHIGGNELFFPFVDAGKQAVKYINVSFDRRGRHKFDNNYLCSVFPFSFFTRCRKLGEVFEFIVFPHAKKCEYQDIFEIRDRHRGEKNMDKAGHDGDVVSFRSYIAGDPLKYIHWKATAKTGQLKTKELSSLFNRPVIVDLAKMPARDIEGKISCATYAVLTLFIRNVAFGLKIKDRIYTSGTYASEAKGQTKKGKIAMLRELALYDAEEPFGKN